MVDLEKRVNWQGLLKTLSLAPTGAALPCAALCTTCRQVSLLTYHDTYTGGYWHFCNGCGFAGDSFQLAAAMRKISVPAAVQWMADQRLLSGTLEVEDIQKYLDGFPRMRARAEAAWAGMQSILEADGRVQSLVGSHDGSKTLWPETGHHLARWTTAERLTELEFQTVLPKGVSKDDLCVLPMRDLPGRIAAFLLVLVVDGSKMVVRRNCLGADGPAAFNIEVLSMLPADKRLIIAYDPLLVAYLQLRGFLISSQRLELVACMSSNEMPAYVRDAGLSRKSIVWWDDKSSAAFSLASRLNAHLAVPVYEITLRHSIHLAGNPRNWLDILDGKSVLWRDALKSELNQLPTQDAAILLKASNIDPTVVDSIISDSNPALIEKVRRSGYFGEERTTCMNGVTIRETREGWKLDKTGELLSDVVIRVDRVLSQRNKPQSVFYQGRLIYHGEDIPFVSPGRYIERRAFQFARQKLLDAGKGLARFKESWQTRAFELSLLFQSPATVESVDGCGWDDKQQQFLLPNFSIAMGGAIRDLPEGFLSSEAPIGFSKPVRLAADELAMLSRLPSGHPLWPILAFVATGALAKVHQQPPLRLAIACDSDYLIDAATCAGCRIVDAKADGCDDLWPIAVVGKTAWRPEWQRWLHADQAVIVRAPETVCKIACANGDAAFLRAAARGLLDEDVARIAKRVIPDFLHYLLQDNLRGGLWTEDLLARCSSAITGYLADRGADPIRPLAEMRRSIHHSKYASFCVGWTLADLYEDGRITVVDSKQPAPLKIQNTGRTRGFTIVWDKEAEKIWLPMDDLNLTLADKGYPRFDLKTIEAKLRKSKHIKGMEERFGVTGWLFSYYWFERHLQRYSVRKRAMLKLAN